MDSQKIKVDSIFQIPNTGVEKHLPQKKIASAIAEATRKSAMEYFTILLS
jgi:hypothetical protein